MNPCIFCEILTGKAPASFVHKQESCVAFLDIGAINPCHTLVVPTRHATSLADLPPEDGAALFSAAQRIAGAIRASPLRCEGVNLLLSDGAVAGQEVFHVHLHVLPRFAGDGFGFSLPKGRSRPGREDLDETAHRIRECLSP